MDTSRSVAGELTLSEEEKTVTINKITKHPVDTMVAIEILDEFPEYKFSEKCGGVRNEEVDLNVLISGIISGVMLPRAKVLPDQLTSFLQQCVIVLRKSMASQKKTLRNMLTNSVALTQNYSCSSGDFLTQM